MNIDITCLKARTSTCVEINEHVTFPHEKLDGTDLLDLKDVTVTGTIKRNPLDTFDIKLNISGIMILPCAITLEPVEYPFKAEVNDELEELLTEVSEDCGPLGNNVDILPIVWESIVIEIPMRVVSPNAKLEDASGEGWKVINDEETDIINPALEKLKDLL